MLKNGNPNHVSLSLGRPVAGSRIRSCWCWAQRTGVCACAYSSLRNIMYWHESLSSSSLVNYITRRELCSVVQCSSALALCIRSAVCLDCDGVRVRSCISFTPVSCTHIFGVRRNDTPNIYQFKYIKNQNGREFVRGLTSVWIVFLN